MLLVGRKFVVSAPVLSDIVTLFSAYANHIYLQRLTRNGPTCASVDCRCTYFWPRPCRGYFLCAEKQISVAAACNIKISSRWAMLPSLIPSADRPVRA
jgi:hypothetical protein